MSSGTFQGQWLRGLRHGYGVRTSAPFGMASHFRPKAPKEGSMTSLKSESAAEPTSERYSTHSADVVDFEESAHE